MIDKKIVKKDQCTGCYACFSACPLNCIEMMSDEEGFYYPSVDYSKCTKCGICITSCPIINKADVNNKPLSYSCFNNDETVRINSSSGGVFTVIAENVILKGGVVFGAGFNYNFDVEHRLAQNYKELEKLKGSKYVQSKIGNSFKNAKKYLDDGKIVLFSGTPCQIAGLKTCLGKDYTNLYCIDLACHGVPSPKFWQLYKKYRSTFSHSNINRISFRDKQSGWKKYSISFRSENDIVYINTLDKDPYMQAFLRNLSLRPSCYNCYFKGISNRLSDITLADYWGVASVYHELDDDKGVSLVLQNTPKGFEMLNDCRKSLSIKECDLEHAISHNSAMVKSVGLPVVRSNFFSDLELHDFEFIKNKYLKPKSIFMKLISVIKNGKLIKIIKAKVM